MTTTAEKIRTRRRQLGLTQTEAAERAGLLQPNWSDYESGKASPTLVVLRRIAVALECEAGELV